GRPRTGAPRPRSARPGVLPPGTGSAPSLLLTDARDAPTLEDAPRCSARPPRQPSPVRRLPDWYARPSMSRREAWLSVALVFGAALVVRTWAAAQISFPQPEDTAYYIDVA